MFDDYIKNHVIIWLIHKYWGEDYYPEKMENILNVRKYLQSFTLKNGVTFGISSQERWLPEVLNDYDWRDLRSDDIVLDIGANIGGFSIFAANKVKKVIAVEPIFIKELKENIRLNKLENVLTINAMLGNPKYQNQSVSFDDAKADGCSVTSFENLIEICGGTIDFLKCDCEGGEAFIPHELLLPIRRIEIEIHNRLKPEMISLRDFIFENWDAYEKVKDLNSTMIHAFKRGYNGSTGISNLE
jgi:FkbM family methyltransferase